MGSVLRRVRKRKQCLGEVEVIAREQYAGLDLSSSLVSRSFIEASTEKLKELESRDLSHETYVTLFLDGKSFADATLVIAMGVTARGDKRFLGLVETNTENEKVLTPFLRSLIERGLENTRLRTAATANHLSRRNATAT